MRLTYNALGIKLTGTLQVCDISTRSKLKSHAVRKKVYTGASKPGESMFVDIPGPFPEILIGNWYWIGLVDNCGNYYWGVFTKTKLQLKKKMDELFENDITHYTS